MIDGCLSVPETSSLEKGMTNCLTDRDAAERLCAEGSDVDCAPSETS